MVHVLQHFRWLLFDFVVTFICHQITVNTISLVTEVKQANLQKQCCYCYGTNELQSH